MKIQDYSNLWNQLENAALVSQIGPNGVEAGAISYHVCKFLKGFKSNANGEYVQFPNIATLLFDRGIFEIWYKTDTYAIIDGTAPAPARGWFEMKGVNAFPRHTFYLSATGINWDWNDGVSVNWAGPVAGWDTPINGIHHIIFVWDRTGIAEGADTRRIYLNGSLIGNSVAARTTANYITPYLMLGNWRILSSGFPANVIMDNVKAYVEAGNISQALIDAIILNSYTNEIEGWPISGRRLANIYNFQQYGGII